MPERNSSVQKGVENSFNAGDSINAINWFDKADQSDVFQYVRGLIAMRKGHPAFRMLTQEQLVQNLQFDPQSVPGLVSYTLNGGALGDSWKKIKVIFNGNPQPKTVSLGVGSWKIFAHGNTLVTPGFGYDRVERTVEVKPYSATILYRND